VGISGSVQSIFSQNPNTNYGSMLWIGIRNQKVYKI
jgi:hypothetical protein